MGSSLRACIVSLRNTYGDRAGNSAYLNSFVRALSEQGVRVGLALVDETEEGADRFHVSRQLLAPFSYVHARGYVRFGEWFVTTRPRRWLRRLRRFLPRRRPLPAIQTESGPQRWLLPLPTAAGKRWARRLVDRQRTDIVIANYFNAAEIFAEDRHVGLGILTHDVLALRAASFREAGEPIDIFPDMLDREDKAIVHADALFAIQPREADWLRERAPLAAVVEVPYSSSRASIASRVMSEPVAVFVGALNRPNTDALRWLLGEIWPEIVKVNSDAKLWVAGRVCESWEGAWPKGATPLGFVSNLADLYSRASVSLAPIRFGSGLKIKVMEALEYCVPVVATSAAAIGFEDAPSSLVRIADDTAAFVDEITNALGGQTPEDLHASLRNYTARKFPSEVVGQRVARALLEVVQKRASMQHQYMSDKRQIAR